MLLQARNGNHPDGSRSASNVGPHGEHIRVQRKGIHGCSTTMICRHPGSSVRRTMKKVERKKKPIVKAKEPPRKHCSFPSLKTKKDESKKELCEPKTDLLEEKNKESKEPETKFVVEGKKTQTVLEEKKEIVFVTPSITPLLYHFRLPNGSRPEIDKSFAEAPPFWLLLDHTLGVIWTLFSPGQQKSNLGVSELHWALEFLKGIRPARGDNPKDVKICINAIEDKLIELYAKLTGTKDSTVFKASETSSSLASTTSLYRNEGQKRRSSGSILSLGRYTESTRKKLFEATSIGSENAPSYPLSVTYEEILHRGPRSLQQLYKAEPNKHKGSEAVIIEEDLESEPSKSIISVPHSRLVEFLADWRQEQVNRIQAELKRLQSIEEFMGELEKADLQPIVEGHLAQKLSEMKSSFVDGMISAPPMLQVTTGKRSSTPERD